MTLWRRGGNCAGGMDDDQGGRVSGRRAKGEKAPCRSRGMFISPKRLHRHLLILPWSCRGVKMCRRLTVFDVIIPRGLGNPRWTQRSAQR